jgi:hypothetical protein
LHYLLTFYGDESQLEPQRLLGSAVRVLHARPVLTRDMIRQTIAMPTFSFLVESNLADAVELVRLTPAPMTVDELSKLWSVYFQTPYNLSVAYQASVVLIESQAPVQGALPVQSRNVYVIPFRQPSIETVRSDEGADTFIVSDSSIVITGKQLRGESTTLRAAGIDVTPAPENLGDTRITVQLPAGLRAGVQGLQVIQSRMIGTPPTAHRGVESNVAPFVLHPRIHLKPDDTLDISISPPVAAADGTLSANVTVHIVPNVGQTQRVVLLMNEFNAPGGNAHAYSFDALPRSAPGDPSETDTVVFPIGGVVAGEYLVRVQVDGAESALERDPDPNNPVFNGPRLTIA